MRKLAARDLTRLSSIQSEAMNDLCNVIRVSRVSGTYSDDETEIRTGTFSVACGFQMTGGQIKSQGQVLLVDYDVLLRLPSTPAINITDEIQLVEKGDTVVSGTFLPASQPRFNSSVQIVELKRVVS